MPVSLGAELVEVNRLIRNFGSVQDLAKIFNDKELELMISGLPEIDVEDMKANCITQNFAPGSRVIHWFWEVISELENQDLALLVQFITGTSKVPLGGFKNLQVIHHEFVLAMVYTSNGV